MQEHGFWFSSSNTWQICTLYDWSVSIDRASAYCMLILSIWDTKIQVPCRVTRRTKKHIYHRSIVRESQHLSVVICLETFSFFLVFPFGLSFWFIEIRLLYISLTTIELKMQTQLDLNSQKFTCMCLLYHHYSIIYVTTML